MKEISRKRYEELKTMLVEHRKELVAEVRAITAQRPIPEGTDENVSRDDRPGSDSQNDVQLTLVEMKAENVKKIDNALTRLEEGQYGLCIDCKWEISERRLKTLPFAIRCVDCAEKREAAEQQNRRAPHRSSLFF